ncbi:MAG: hypothetical protein IJF80_07505 [Clostridia bacterium]|nr:hypothetical protein [Clostridia bacterium]
MSNAIKKNFDVNLDICQSTQAHDFTVVQGDTGNVLTVYLKDSGEKIDLTDCFIQAVFLRPDGSSSVQDNNGHGITVTNTGEFEITLYASSVSPGIVECEIQIFSDEDKAVLVTSSKFNFHCRKPILNDDTVSATPEFPLLIELLGNVTKLEKDVKTAIQDANYAADLAVDAAIECFDVLDTMPDDIPPPFLRTVYGTNPIITDACKGTDVKSCVIVGKCNVTRPDENSPVSENNIAVAEPALASYIQLKSGTDIKTFHISPVELAGITPMSADLYDLISGKLTTNIFVAAFTGDEDWTIVQGENGNPDYYRAPLAVLAKNYSALICSHFPAVDFKNDETIETYNSVCGCCILQNEIRIRPRANQFMSLDDFKNALRDWNTNNQPLKVYYELLSPRYVYMGRQVMTVPSEKSSFSVSSDSLSTIEITYCCDLNFLLSSGSAGNVLRKRSYHNLDLEWVNLTASDVRAASATHAHGNISSSGSIGKETNLPVFTSDGGVLTTIQPEDALTILGAPSLTEFKHAKSTIPLLNKKVISNEISLHNMREDIGVNKLLICGDFNISKPNGNLPISPANIATITFPQPDYLSIRGTDGRETFHALDALPKLFGIGTAYDTYEPSSGIVSSYVSSLTLSGEEEWSMVDASSPYFTMSLPMFADASTNIPNSICTHFEGVTVEAISASNAITGCCVHDSTLCIRPPDIENYPTLTAWKSFLASQSQNGTPVTVHYERTVPDIYGGMPLNLSISSGDILRIKPSCFLNVEYTLDAKEIGRIECDFQGSSKSIASVTDGCEYHFGALDRLVIPNGALPVGNYSFSIYFDTKDSITVSMPSSIRWAGGTAPEFLPNKTYELSIKDGLGKLEVYNNA